MWHETLQLKSDIRWNLSAYFTNRLEKGIFLWNNAGKINLFWEKMLDFLKKYMLDTLCNISEWTTVHLWKFSTSLKFGLYFAYIFITDWNFLTKFCSSDPSFNRNILTSLNLKSETSRHALLHDYSFIRNTYTFHDMVSVGNLH